MSFLIHQSEINDCGVAICVMVLNQFENNWTLERFKVEHQYNHEQYSFAVMNDLLKSHEIEVQSYTFDDLADLKSVKELICFQVSNTLGQLHFILGRYLNNNRWLIYDPAKFTSLIYSDEQLLAMSTLNVQIYQNQKFKKTFSYQKHWKIVLSILKVNGWGIIFTNLFLVANLLMMILLNSFLRIVFQDFVFLTVYRMLLLLVGLTSLVCLNWIMSYLLKIILKSLANRYFQKIVETKSFGDQFFQAHKYLYLNDFEKNYFQFQNNVYSLNAILSKTLGLLISLVLIGLYFFWINQILGLTSIILVFAMISLKIFKLKTSIKQNLQLQFQQNWYLTEFRLLAKNYQVIKQKTSLNNYLSLKNLDSLLIYQLNPLTKRYEFFERFLIYLYYLVLCLLIEWNNQAISSLIIFTSITLVWSNEFQQMMQSWFNYDYKNYFNQNLILNLTHDSSVNNFKVTFHGKQLIGNYLVLKNDDLNNIQINYQNLTENNPEIYFANKAINLDESIYYNIFNYEIINLEFLKKLNLNRLFAKYDLDLAAKPVKENLEIIKYLSCFFAKQQVIVLNFQKNQELLELLTKTFKDKTFLFIND